uniref:Protein tesmin/TSO1-like CXC 2 n=1 Tax=Elaeis guineensis var. tenera TaxID=51953 RepID=A0A8N4IFM2_ELAGV|nr:protein tesmin/TSO1-like CXC 2 [Elaeis guineensis]
MRLKAWRRLPRLALETKRKCMSLRLNPIFPFSSFHSILSCIRKKPTGKDDSQQCSCKKSNCLKLYCDCFASGSFCAEACRCNDCYNKYEYEEIVSESKERIQSRTPNAFSPKIIRHDSRNMITTSSRHRVGCNCRKSMCMKNYCECFKAHVGCSSVCRCEDCKNTFGAKNASGEIGEMKGESETVKVKSDMTKPEQCHTGFSCLTPCIQSSIQNEPNPSVAPGTSVLSSYTDSWNSPIDSTSRTSFVKAGQGTQTFSSHYQASGSHDAENFGSFLPHCDHSGRNVFGPSSNSNLLQMNVIQGRDHLSVNSLPLTGESSNELDSDSNCGPCNNLEHNYDILKDSSSNIKPVKTS